MKTEKDRVYQFHISLLDVEPMIWRRIRVPAYITFDKLHEIIQVVMGWENCHLYEFRYGPQRIGIPDEEFLAPDQQTVVDASRRSLQSMKFSPDDFMTYTYDFGDNWVHLIRVEAVLAGDESRPKIECLAGERACPPEDIGGSQGYQEFRALLCKPSSLEKRQQIEEEYAGLVDLNSFKPESFDLVDANKNLRSLLG